MILAGRGRSTQDNYVAGSVRFVHAPRSAPSPTHGNHMTTILAALIALGLLAPGSTVDDIPESWGASWGDER